MSEPLYVIGMMSGSSCDAVDAALVRVEGDWPSPKVRLLLHTFRPMDADLQARLLDPALTLPELAVLDMAMGRFMGTVAQRLNAHAGELGMPPAAWVASHGHTLAHVPPNQEASGTGTLQIGCPAAIAAHTGLPVVADFRKGDMAAGGQGAPLVPFADWALFHKKRDITACLNIGGIANATVVTPAIEEVVAFDTGPGNMPIDGAVRIATGGTAHCDRDGAMAKRGRVHKEALKRLLAHPYFDRPLPKTTGREEFDAPVFLREVLGMGLSHDDLVATVTAATAESIAHGFREHVLPRYRVKRIVVSGGGVRNPVLMAAIQRRLAPIPVATDTNWPPDIREAVAFALLGWARVRGIPANVPSATGASRPAMLGSITQP